MNVTRRLQSPTLRKYLLKAGFLWMCLTGPWCPLNDIKNNIKSIIKLEKQINNLNMALTTSGWARAFLEQQRIWPESWPSMNLEGMEGSYSR